MRTTKRTRRDAKRLFRLCIVDGMLDISRVRLVAQRILEAHRRSSPALLHQFLHLIKLYGIWHTAEIESATPLPDEVRASVEADLTRLYGPGIRASFTQNTELIGGMRIKIGSDVFDGSVKAGLDALEKSF
jgi:F-type H+-transporting ATPase subunit delta